MPIVENITIKRIIDTIHDRISSYNENNPQYNRAYGAFISSRSAAISASGGIAEWLNTSFSSISIRNLLITFGMDGRGSSLVNLADFNSGLAGIPDIINIGGLEGFDLSKGPLSTANGNSTIAIELGKLFEYCAIPGHFSASGGFVIGSKVAHCILPKLCPMVDNKHIGISLYNIHQDDYYPPGNNWQKYIGHVPVGKTNPSPRGAGRNSWQVDQILCAVGLYARIYEEWQAANGRPGLEEFLKLDSIKGTTGIPRLLDKVMW